VTTSPPAAGKAFGFRVSTQPCHGPEAKEWPRGQYREGEAPTAARHKPRQQMNVGQGEKEPEAVWTVSIVPTRERSESSATLAEN
jgi:hypothetical protein